MAKIRKVLVANRGEIAIRVMRTCKELGIATVAVYSEADRSALHVRTADEAWRVGPPPSRESYLAQERILEAAKRAGADAIHPGYGFLAENAAFARACEQAGLVFIGPSASAMEAMGEKTRARQLMVQAGVPVVPGTTEALATQEEALAQAVLMGFPVMLKAAGGGGGKGMRRVEREQDFESAWRAAKSEALNAFGNDAVYIEKYVEKPHHVEVQVFADAHGHTLHLNERECSAQRRHQKVVEETPSPILTPELRARMGEVAVRAVQAVGYVGAGTVEFLVDAHRNFYFLEMNTRLQVEHPVTEWVTGLDLVALQIRVAEGEPLPFTETPEPRGHALEVRIYAEDPARGFMPSPGRIRYLRVPGGPFIRDDSGVFAGYTVPGEYDPLISKLSVWAPTRREAIARARRALDEYVVKGITTNVRYLKEILGHPEFVGGDYDTSLLTREHEALVGRKEDPRLTEAALLASVVYAYQRDQKRARTLARAAGGGAGGLSAWRLAGRRWRLLPGGFPMRYFAKLQGQEEAVPVELEPAGEHRFELTLGGRTFTVDALALEHGAVSLLVDGVSYDVEFEEEGDEVRVLVRGQLTRIDVADERRLRLRAGAKGLSVEGRQVIAAPMPGKVVKVLVALGDEVREGQGLVVVEAMKMENELKSPKSGKVVELPAREGTAVELDEKLVVVE